MEKELTLIQRIKLENQESVFNLQYDELLRAYKTDNFSNDSE